jgi:hydroxymethylbilane synthase
LSFTFPSLIKIASRSSRLALWQAEHVQAQLIRLYPECQVKIVAMTTKGDQILDRSLSKVGGKGLFVKELEVAMLEERADLAVHSLKDVPMVLPEGFILAAFLEREDPRDAFVSNDYSSLSDLPNGAIVGTSSLRRQALIKARFPNLIVEPLRGNLDTRLSKLDQGQYAAIILAAAGLKRLGLESRIREYLSIDSSLPAAGQGVMAIEILSKREELISILAPLNHKNSEKAVRAERKVSEMLGGSCQVPLAAFARCDGDQIILRAAVASLDGSELVYAEQGGVDPDALGKNVAEDLIAKGALRILSACQNMQGDND